MNISNKTIQYRVYAENERGVMELLSDSADITLPTIEKMTDTLSGAGIMGEIDWPAFGQAGAMSFTLNFRADQPQYAALSRPGVIKFMVVWVTDKFDTSGMNIGIQQHKLFMTAVNKSYNPGTVGNNAAADGSAEFECFTYRKLVDGREVLLIDKLNYKYAVNGVDHMAQVRTALQ